MTLKTYSVLFNWADNDPEQGTYGTYVRAKDYDEAERLGRLDMRNNHLSNHPPEDGETEDEACSYYEDTNLKGEKEFGGSMIECHEGAIWKAHDLEVALRTIIARINGVWDDPEVMKLGPLMDTGSDCRRIAEEALKDIDRI